MSQTPNPSRPSALRRFGRTVKGFLLWRHERGSWQYDVMCLIIFLFVVLTPLRYFHDQPVYRPLSTLDLVRLRVEGDEVCYRVSAELLADYDPDPWRAAEEVMAQNLTIPVTLTRIEEVKAEDGTIVWYDVWVRGKQP
ncbi:MAG: hypothetical protein ACE5G6_08870 [Terriglobia bacterium]